MSVEGIAGVLIGRAERLASFTADPALRARFSAIVQRFEAGGAQLDATKIEKAHAQLVSVLTTRLRLAADRVAYPQIAEQSIEKPIFVVGFPRAGTTFLHYLLAADPDSRSPRLWEVRNPSPPPGVSDEGGRIAAGDADALAWCRTIPGMLAAHPYFDKGGQVLVEDEELMALDFHSSYPCWYPDVPMARVSVNAPDPMAGYAFHRQFLQHLQLGRPQKHWACKGPAHQFTLPALLATYPDATCVWPHRNPAETFGSIIHLNALVHEGIRGEIDRPAMAAEMLAGLRAGIDEVLRCGVADDPRIIHVQYGEVVSDPIACVRDIYDRCGRSFSDAHERAARAWLDDPANASNRHGRFRYNLADYGLSPEGVDHQFADYSERFLKESASA